jgi:drug/metabolite transporter (DMT)-like permease
LGLVQYNALDPWQEKGQRPDTMTAPRENLLTATAPGLFVVMWATGFVVSRLTAHHVDPFTFLALRFPIAGLIFLIIAILQRAPWPDGRGALHAAVAGALIHAAYLGPIYWAVTHGVPAGVSALIVGLQPLLTAFAAALLLGEALARRHWVGLVVGLTGVALVIWPKLTFAAAGLTPITVAACLVGTCGISFGTIYQKKFATGLHIATGGVWQYAGASLVVGSVALAFEDRLFDRSLQAWSGLAWSVVVLSLGAVSLLMLLIRRGAVGKVASLIYLVPAVAAVMAYFMFGETLVPLQLIGMALCAAAVLIVNRTAPASA